MKIQLDKIQDPPCYFYRRRDSIGEHYYKILAHRPLVVHICWSPETGEHLIRLIDKCNFHLIVGTTTLVQDGDHIRSARHTLTPCDEGEFTRMSRAVVSSMLP
jgi:hypothetical protein